jgi:hypothetical protein
MMKNPNQLTQLIWSFYRENPLELKQLNSLGKCQVRRRWGALQIHCDDLNLAEAVATHHALLEAPVAQLRIAQRIKIFENKCLFAVFNVNPSVVNY